MHFSHGIRLAMSFLLFSMTQLSWAQVKIPEESRILDSLKEHHPRVIATEDDFERTAELIRTDPTVSDWYKTLHAKGQEILSSPVSSYEIPDGLRLLSTSRRVLERAYTLAFLCRIEKDTSYADRLWKELEAAAAFPDWNPRHFLDTAEMTHAFAISFDWLFQHWSEGQRTALMEAIIKHGLEPAITAYEGKSKYGSWTKAEHNWNQVCNGGIGIGALAIASERPALARRILREALPRLPKALQHYGPDGAWNEGPGYWHYATRYTVYILAALQSALGSDFGISSIPGLSEAGSFPIFMTGPTGNTFNFGDGGEKGIAAEEMFWLAKAFRRPDYGKYQVRRAEPTVLDLLWYPPELLSQETEPPPLTRYYRDLEGVSMRTRWDDPGAFFVGFKAGDNRANHSNLDIGSFVLDAHGERWVIDLGRDDYNLPGYFQRSADGKRWTYYRMRAEGHNTLVINPKDGPDQDPETKGRIVAFHPGQRNCSVTADLTPAYAVDATHVHRRLDFYTGQEGTSTMLEVNDDINTRKPSEVWWFLHTPSQITLVNDGRSARLSIEGEQLWLDLHQPVDARFEVMQAAPLPTSPNPSGQSINRGVQKLAIHLRNVRRTTIQVRIHE